MSHTIQPKNHTARVLIVDDKEAKLKEHFMRRLLDSSPVTVVAVAAVYAMAAKVSFLFTIPPGNVSPIFPSAGIALAAVMILGRRALAGVWLGSFAANAMSFYDGTVSSVHAVMPNLLIAAFIGAGAMTGAGAGGFLMRRFCQGEHPLDGRWSVLTLVAVGALGCCMVTATVGVFSLTMGGYIPWDRAGYSWVTWWVGDAAGTIIAAPLILAWHQPHPFRKNGWRTLEAAVLGGVTLLLCFFVFFRNVPFAYGLMPLLLWAAFRFGMRGASSAAAVIAILATIGTSHGGGPFARDTVNESLLFLHSFLDVTIISALLLAGVLAERKQVEESLRKSEQQFRLIMENLDDLVAVLDLDGRRLYNSPSYQAILGDPIRLRGTSSFEQVHPEDRTRVQQAFQETVRTGVGQRLEYRMVGWDGQVRYIESQGSVIRDGRGRMSQVIVVSRNVTARREAERALRESEQKYRELVMLANSIILRWSRDGRINFLNEFGQRFFGYTEAEICGRHVVGTIVPPSESGGRNLSFLMDEICANPASFEQSENENMRRNGERVWICWTNRVMLDEHCQVAGILSVGVDVTARRRVEEELRAAQASLEERILVRTTELAVARDRAEEADRLKSAFLAAMSHELRTPLNSIIGFTGILLQGLAGPLNAEQTKQLGMVRSSARHLLELINDVLDLSKIEAGQLEVRAEAFDLPASIKSVTASLKPLAERKGLTLTAEVSPGLGEMVGDQRRLEQILLNLLNNSIKFTERGSVALTVEPVADYRPSPDAAPGPAVRLRVTDTGIGIKPADLASLFQPFRQIDTGLARQHEGTGLGLAICRRLAALMGGEITATSQWLHGSEFTVTLPLSKVPVLCVRRSC
jgi:PAS domain S-box-containing protein